MKPSNTWGFTAPHSDIDLSRIVREAGTGPKAILLKIGNSTFTLARRLHILAVGIQITPTLSYGAITPDAKVKVSGSCVGFDGLDSSPPPVFRSVLRDPRFDVLVLAGDLVKKIVGGVAVSVEVF